MACEYCVSTNGHDPRCTNYIPPKTNRYCSACKEFIQYGEEYIMNEDNECCHLDCFCGMKDLAEWLGYEVKIMDDYD